MIILWGVDTFWWGNIIWQRKPFYVSLRDGYLNSPLGVARGKHLAFAQDEKSSVCWALAVGRFVFGDLVFVKKRESISALPLFIWLFSYFF
jgi:hypothetical protein